MKWISISDRLPDEHVHAHLIKIHLVPFFNA